MMKTNLWQDSDFPHFYHNSAVGKPLEGAFRMEVADQASALKVRPGGRTALRDLNELQERGLMVKTGQLKGTRYHLNIPHLIERL